MKNSDTNQDKNELALIDAPFTYTTLQAIISTSFVPKGLRGDTMSALACILYGRELGLGPMQAMRYVDVIDGKPSPTGEYMVSRIFGAGHIVYAETQTDKLCTVVGRRFVDGVEVTSPRFTFTIEMADRAGLLGKNNWKKYPEAMLYWRAVAQLSRQFFPDVIGGLSHLPEELGSDDWVEAPVVDVDDAGKDYDDTTPIETESVSQRHVPDLPDEPLTEIEEKYALSQDAIDTASAYAAGAITFGEAQGTDDWNLLLATLEVLPTSKDTVEAWRAYAKQMTDLMVRTGCWKEPAEDTLKGLLKDELMERVTAAHEAAQRKAAENAPF